MLFGIKTRPISDFFPRILSNIDGVDTDMLSSYVMDAVIEFLKVSQVLTEIICITIEPCINSYQVKTNYRFVELLSLRLFINGVLQPKSRYNLYVDNGVLYVPDINCGDAVVELECVVVPWRDSEEVPDFVYEEYVAGITALALAKLYLLTGNDWYNATASNNQMVVYQQEVRSARFHKISKHKPFQMRLANKGIN